MNVATTVVRWVVRIGGLAQLVLGILFWSGNALTMIPMHMLLGIVLVLGLVILAALGAVARVGWGRVVLAVLWAPLVVWLGLNQATLLVGEAHWLIEVVHLIVGLAALAQAEALAGAVLSRPRPAARVGVA